ncbi:hypothetical protein SBA5_120080 [Candidatus Sulfotelmatomonas gaucii]|uniref:Uncharacterized protein n=1 Tax=Candidatus Sulfuritelmatomonas gaucii TaxID=2043161 RepID=A0A2N9L4L7_9BACT|nr:hypothetical protein SBA5_120080 [Candidatus Sulfotelmatomonas gaucii]
MTADRNDAREGAPKRRPEPEVRWTYVPRLAPGDYPAYCRSAKIYQDRVFKRWVCAAQFDLLDENLKKIARLTWFLNLGSGDKPQVTRRRNYWAAWVKANGGPPQRRDRMSPRIFARRYATVVVDDTTRDSRQELATKELAYSVIRDVARWDTGGREQRGAVSLSTRGSANSEFNRDLR